MIRFTDLNLQPEIQKALDELGFTNPTEIQVQAIPVLKDNHTDFHGQAQTGTGKTIAFGIPLIEQIEGPSNFPQALVVVPTRELVVQIVESLQSISKYRNVSIEPIYGGVSIIQQEKALRKGVHIIVGTPGRLLDHLRRGMLKLHKLKIFVLDEADIMLDMGFKPDIDALLKCIPASRNIWLFSATVKPGIDDIKKLHMKDPVVARITPKQVTTKNTKQYYVIIPQKDRLTALSRFIDCAPDFYGIIFMPTKVLADQVSKTLSKKGYAADALHGNMSQALRNKVIKKFKDKKITLLVATDVAARGIDVVGLTHVINYAMPREQESYVHRIGRTGRAGSEGSAITFIAHSELNRLKRLAYKFKADIVPLEVPTVGDLIDKRVDKTAEQIKTVCSDASSVSPSIVSRLRPLLDTYSKDELVNGMLHMLSSSLGLSNEQETVKGVSTVDDSLQELMLNVGTIDGISQDDVLKFLVNSKKLERKDIKKLRVIRKRSFFTIPSDRADYLAMALHSKTLRGRKVQVRFVP